MGIYTSYGAWKYSRTLAKERANVIVKVVNKVLSPQLAFDACVVTGTSGSWLGAALVAHPDWNDKLPLVLCRKPQESSHGPILEGESRANDCRRFLLIDDFVCTGETVRRVAGTLLSDDSRKQLVGVLEHQNLSRGVCEVLKSIPVEGLHIPCFG